MGRKHAYPADLADYVVERWPTALPLSRELLRDAIAIAYQASLTVEEARPTRFRLLLTPADALPENGTPNQGVLRLRFDRSRPLRADELRRLSPATPFETALIGAHVEDEQLRIWGIAHSGPAWLAPTWGGRAIVPIWSRDPIIHVTGPGQVAVRTAGQLIGALEGGVLVDSLLDVLDAEWVRALFADVRDEVRAEHDALQAQAASPTTVDAGLVARVGQQLIRRAIQVIRNGRHGGMILVADTSVPGALDGVRLKYQFDRGEPAHRYRTLLMQILEMVSAATPKTSVGWADFADDESPAIERVEQSIFELSRLLGNLAAIDGAVVVDKGFRILGFGAEVLADLASPVRVCRAYDLEGRMREAEDVENVGTRHRAAYRFVTAHPRGLAIVVSQDGGVSVIANREGHVVYWAQSVSP